MAAVLINAQAGGSQIVNTPAPIAGSGAAAWTRLASAPQARRGAYAFAVQGKAYIVSGMAGSGDPDNVCWQYDPTSNAWTVRQPYPGMPVVDGAAFAVGGKGYVVFGHNNNDSKPRASREVWEYDPAADSWRQRCPFPGEGRTGVSVVVLGGKAYCFGGMDKDYSGAIRELWEYDSAADAWRRRAVPPAAGTMVAGFGIGSKAYFYKGDRLDTPRFFLEYDMTANTWTARRPFPGATNGGAIGASRDGRGYLYSGFITTPVPFVESREVWSYDPAADAWTRMGDAAAPGRAMAAGFVIGNDFYLGLGGPGRGNLSDFWRWRP